MNILRLATSYRYEAVAFLTGAAVMVLEIVGTRLMSPDFGTSTYVWTAMIGVILASLATGFAVGGKLADKYHNSAVLSFILFFAAILVLGMGMVQQTVLSEIANLGLDARLGALLAALLLFGLPSGLIGMVSPHLAKLCITSLESTGRSIGRLEAAGTLGSIAGTFSCGYFLLGQFGSRTIVIGIVLLLIITSFIADPSFYRRLRLSSLFLAIALAGVISLNPKAVLADIDSSYARYRVVSGSYGLSSVNLLMTDSGSIQSAAAKSYLNNKVIPGQIVLPYIQQFFDAAATYDKPQRVLVIGGGTYTLPTALVRSFPDIQVDVVEIDPALDQLAKDYFGYKPSPRLTVHHTDGRVFLNSNRATYDVVYMDAFSSLSPPFQLTTSQTVQRIKSSLAPDGVVVINLVGRYNNGEGDYIRALRTTYANSFRHTALYQTRPELALDNDRQNFMMYAANSPKNYQPIIEQTGKKPVTLQPGGLLLTDNYAPTERLTY